MADAVLGARSELVTQVDAYLKKGGIYDTSQFPVWLQLAEDWIAANLRVRQMEAFATLRMEATVDGGTVGGSANAITLTPTTASGAYALGDTWSFTATATNTATTTVNISGQGVNTINKRSEGEGNVLEAGDIVNGGLYHLWYDGTNFILIPRGGIVLPTRFLEMRRLTINTSPVKVLTPLPQADFWERWMSSTAGEPSNYTMEGDYIVVGPAPDGNYFLKLDYYRRFANMTGATDDNWALDNARGLYLYGCLVEGYSFLGDDQNVAKYALMRDSLLADLHRMDKRSRFAPGSMVMKTGVTVR